MSTAPAPTRLAWRRLLVEASAMAVAVTLVAVGEVARRHPETLASDAYRLPEQLQASVVPAASGWASVRSAPVLPPPVVEAVSPPSGPASVGAIVTLVGRNLHPARVRFGAAPARIVSSSYGAVTVVVPPAPPGRVTIALEDWDGHALVIPGGFAFVD